MNEIEEETNQQNIIQNKKEIEILFKVPQEFIQDIKLNLYLDMTLLEVKQEIQQQHQLKPSIKKQKLVYSGKVLYDDNLILKQILEGKNLDELVIFHLQIGGKIQQPQVNQEHVQSVQQNDQQNNNQEQQNQRKPLTKEEIYISDQFQNYEIELFNEYLKQIQDLSQKKVKNQTSYNFSNQQLESETNMDYQTYMLLTKMPIMDQKFQERLSFHTAVNFISLNAYDLNENIAIRFLGYDSILQFTLIGKLAFFMFFFGMNAYGIKKWLIMILLICYYFYKVRNIYIDHYERQRRLLNLEQNNQNQQDFIQNIINRYFFGRNEQQNQQQNNVVLQKIKNIFSISFIIVFHFVLSFNHVWTERRLNEYDRQRIIQQQQEQQNQQAREQQQVVQEENKQEEVKQQTGVVQRNVEQSQKKGEDEDDDILFNLDDDLKRQDKEKQE